jgi:hypothetical protein
MNSFLEFKIEQLKKEIKILEKLIALEKEQKTEKTEKDKKEKL